jgi:hypothetical protein
MRTKSNTLIILSYTYIRLALYSEGVAEASQIFLRGTFYHNYLAMSNTADVISDKPSSDRSPSGVSPDNP